MARFPMIETPGMLPRVEFDRVFRNALSMDAMAVALLHGDKIVGTNPGFEALFGPLPFCANPTVSDLAVEADRVRVSRSLEEACRKMQSRLRLDFQARGADGPGREVELHWIHAGDADDALAVAFLFESNPRERGGDDSLFLAFLDPLTGLANRAQLLDRLRDVLTEARWFGNHFAVMLADLDGFAAVNTAYGPTVAKRLLGEIGNRLAACLREDDTAARQSGDEFAVLLRDLDHIEDAVRVAERIIAEVSVPIHLDEGEFHLAMNVGIAVYPDHAQDVESLFSHADAALAASKQAGRNACRLAGPSPGCEPKPLEFVSWKEAHACGVEIIDEQHRELFARINRLGSELMAARGPERLHAAFDALIEAVRHHFRSEERLMLMSKVPDLEAHSEQHRKLLADLKNLRPDLERRSVALTMRYLEEWLRRHMAGADKQVAPLLRAAGCP